MNKEKIAGGLLLAIALGGVGYLTYRAYLKWKKEQEAILTPDDIRAELEVLKMTGRIDDVQDDIPEDSPYEDEDDLLPAYYKHPDYDENNMNYDLIKQNEEEKDMAITKVHPDSIEALDRYIDMRLADIRSFDGLLLNENTYDIMRMLFESGYAFIPENECDQPMVDNLLQIRAEFFGEDGKWAKQVTWAEVILYFAERSEYDIDGEVANYCDDWLYKIGIDIDTGAASIAQILNDLNRHIFINDEGFGLFSLNEEQYQEMISGVYGRVVNGPEEISFTMEHDRYITGMMEIIGEDDDDYEEDDYE